MEPEVVIDVISMMLWTALKVALPMLLAALGTGLMISLLQAMTQVQEMTLTFIPKIFAVVAALMLSMSYMINTLTEFAREIFSRLTIP